MYDAYFHPTEHYKGGFQYKNAVNYGFVGFETREYPRVRTFTADEYVAFTGTHCDHIVLPEPYRSKFFDGIRQAIMDAGGQLVSYETDVLYLTQKPSP